MATYTIISDTPPFLIIKVEFGEQSFVQQLVTTKTGAARAAQLQAYADQYESDWNMLPATPVPEVAEEVTLASIPEPNFWPV